VTVAAALREKVADGYKIVIVSNQGPLNFPNAERSALFGRDVPPK
jgi:histidinol phosphatase-like enzyme